MAGELYSRALQRAAQLVGGKARLRELLHVSMRDLERWIAGAEPPPQGVFLRAVDIISESPSPASSAVERARQLRHKAEDLLAKAAAARERATAVHRAILERQSSLRAQPMRASALDFLRARFEPRDGGAMVEAALDAAISATGADMGNLQIVCADGLRIVAQRGFERPFLDFFAVVGHPSTACGVALKSSTRVTIADVRSDLLFAGTEAGEVLAEAGVRAVQSTPLVAEGGVVGILSTHYACPHDVNPREEDVLDHIARRAAFWLEGGASQIR